MSIEPIPYELYCMINVPMNFDTKNWSASWRLISINIIFIKKSCRKKTTNNQKFEHDLLGREKGVHKYLF